jgi:flagellin FlaB
MKRLPCATYLDIRDERKLKKRHGITGIETALILVAFVITVSAFSFVILNIGFLTSDKTQTTVVSGMKETASSLVAETGVAGYFTNTTTGDQSEVCLTEVVFYIRLAQGHEPIDCSDDTLLVTYTNQRAHTIIYSNEYLNGTITTIKTVTGDNDSLLEVGEKIQVSIDFTQISKDDCKPVLATSVEKYGKPYESVRIEIHPIVGTVLAIEREIPPVHAPVQTLK